MAKNKTTVRVGGKDYDIVSDDSQEYVQRVAAYVDRKMGELGVSPSAKMSGAMLAVLTSLNIADELFRAQDDISRIRKDLSEARAQVVQLQRENTAIKDQMRGAASGAAERGGQQ